MEMMTTGFHKMIARIQSFSWLFQPFIVKVYLLRQAGARLSMGLVDFAHQLQSLEPGNTRKATSRNWGLELSSPNEVLNQKAKIETWRESQAQVAEGDPRTLEVKSGPFWAFSQGAGQVHTDAITAPR